MSIHRAFIAILEGRSKRACGFEFAPLSRSSGSKTYTRERHGRFAPYITTRRASARFQLRVPANYGEQCRGDSLATFVSAF